MRPLPEAPLIYPSQDHRPARSSRTDRLQQMLDLRPSGPREPRQRSIRTGVQRRNSQSSSSSSTSAERGGDDDNDWDLLQQNDSVSSLAPSLPDSEMQARDEHVADSAYDPPANTLPAEILLNIFSRLLSTHDLLSCMLVSKHWARNSVAMLWHRPLLNQWTNVERVVKAMRNERRMFSYPSLIKRLNLASVGAQISDGSLLSMSACNRIERLTLTGCSQLSDTSLMPIIAANRNLVALDLTKLERVSDRSLLAVAEHCHRLQGLNVSDCAALTDAAVIAVAKACNLLKRLKFTGCRDLTSASISMVAMNCPNLLEIDLGGLPGIDSSAVADLLPMCKHLRELRLAQCPIDDTAFTRHTVSQPMYEALRVLDLTNCSEITDRAVESIADTCPRLRNLVLSKCRNLTDRAVFAITKLGKNLHFVHLGHCIRLTDDAISALAKSCARIRYIDLACCSNLTDASIAQLAANLPKLKRVGLVKCSGITDRGILDLATLGGRTPRIRHGLFAGNGLERVHLSYCTSLTPLGIHALLNNCPKLTHLSLTGVHPFLTSEIQGFCRKAPPEFNDHQSQMFCVFSGSGVAQLRAYLNQPDVRRNLMSMRTPPWGAVDIGPFPPHDQPAALDAIDVDEDDFEEEVLHVHHHHHHHHDDAAFHPGQVVDTVEQEVSPVQEVPEDTPSFVPEQSHGETAREAGASIPLAHHVTGLMGAAVLGDGADADEHMTDDRDDWRRSQAPGP